MKRLQSDRTEIAPMLLLVTVQVEVSFCWKMSTNHNKKRKSTYITTTTTTTEVNKQKTHTYFSENQNSIIFHPTNFPHHSVVSPFSVGLCSFNTKLRPMKACQPCQLRGGGAGEFTVDSLTWKGIFVGRWSSGFILFLLIYICMYPPGN